MRQQAFHAAFQAIEHADALVVAFAKSLVVFLRDVTLQHGDVEVVHALERLTTRAIDSLDPIPDVPIAVFLCQVGWCTVRRSSQLRCQLETFVSWPAIAMLANFKMQGAQLLVHMQILNTRHSHGSPPPKNNRCAAFGRDTR